jgi:tetratricopeptide (TPR) repeat protein
MKARTILYGLLILPLCCAVAVPAQTPNADFQQAVAAYQQSPSEATARSVIRLAAAMDPLPPIPEEARRHFVRGTALFKDAKSPDDYKQVVDEFTQATHLAPWWPEARYNLALAQEAAGDYASAISNMKLYLLFKLPDADARAAQDKTYVLEARQEKAAKAKADEAAAPVVAAPPQNSFEALLGKMNGRRYTCHISGPGGEITQVLDVRGDVFVRGSMEERSPYAYRPQYQESDSTFENSRFKILGRETTLIPNRVFGGVVSRTFVISEDGNRITERAHNSDGTLSEFVYLWQR